jgi:replicative DNA helicase
MTQPYVVDFRERGPKLHRWNAEDSCPICGGHPYLPHGVGRRCYGFSTGGGRYAHCTREEYAEGLEATEWGTYQHDLKKFCRCGIDHTIGPVQEIYTYTQNGDTPYQIVRFKPKDRPKDFRPRRKDGDGNWHVDLEGIEKILYNLDAVREAHPDEYICYCEGEKDANTCSDHGLIATTHAGGANGWRADFAVEFRGKKVVLFPHNDGDSRRMVKAQLADLVGVAAEVKVVELPGLKEHGDITDWFEAGGTVDELGELVNAAALHAAPRLRIVPAGDWILHAPAGVPAVWGQGQVVLWSKGEPFEVAGPTGIGKGTLLQQIALRRCGLIRTTLFGLPVEVSDGVDLYLALDRPHQIRRSMARMVEQKDLVLLNSKLLIWHGQLPFNLTNNPEKFAPFLEGLGVRTVYIDSLKDAFLKLNSDEGGAAVQYAFSEAMSAGIEVAASHHMRKKQGEDGGPTNIDSVYGSQMITASAGSVVLLWGSPGDPVFELRHLKQPAEQFNNAKVRHDQITGTMGLLDQPDLQIVLQTVKEITVKQWAVQMFGKSEAKLTANEVEKARRALDGKVKSGDAKRIERVRPQGGKPEVVYSVVQPRK